MTMPRKWITPFKKQCFVVIGSSINMSQAGMVSGIAACLISQLKQKDAIIAIDDTSGSWIASVPGLAMLLGNVIVPVLMAKCGRQKTNILSVLIVLVGWIGLATASGITWLLITRAIQGTSLGMTATLTPIIIGEYTSPKNRGSFSILMSVVMAGGTLIVHTVGAYLTWKKTAIICIIITILDLLIMLMSPETPSWLADQGRYDDCKKSFLWLRGLEESEELQKMIDASKVSNEVRSSTAKKLSISKTFAVYVQTIKQRAFYKPIIIMMHLYVISHWAGMDILAPYVGEITLKTMGANVDARLIMISLDVQRIISSASAVLIIRHMKRRNMLFVTCGFNALILLLNAGYIFAKSKDSSFDHPVIGGLLLHGLMMAIATGSLPLPYVIAGEIFPVRYRNLSSGISNVFFSVQVFLSVKSFFPLYESIGLDRTYLLYAVIVTYSLIVVWFILPETKDRTLQEIEDEFKGKIVNEELKSVQPLTVYNYSEDLAND